MNPWFFVEYIENGIRYTENIVIGDNIFSDGLRVLSFSTKDALHYLSHSTTIHGDGTFEFILLLVESVLY